ncbi:MAG: tetratricopeptide repeat protein [Cyclobacteriaceae bacterium]|nr:tetratricopeptide repeat protein [Cyclobacteriaceae bacterium]
MRNSLFTVFLMFLITLASGQNLQLIDSIQHQLVQATGERKYDLLNDLAWEYRWAFPDSTIIYATQADQLGAKLSLKTNRARSLNFIGVAYNYKGDRLQAYDYYNRALALATTQFDSLQIAHSNNNIGRLLFDQGLLAKSYDYFVSALTIFKALNDPSGLAYTYQSLANLYKSQRDFEKSENYYLSAYTIRLSLKNTRDIMSALVQLGRLYQENGQHDKALKYFHLADSAGHIIDDAINLAEIKTFTAESYLSKGSLKEAEKICSEGLDYILQSNNLRMVPQAYLTMGQILMAKRDDVAAKKYFTKALEVASRTQDLNSKMESHYFLWKVSQGRDNKSEELMNYNQYLILKDSIKDLDLARQVERFQFEMEIERKQRENELLKLNEARSEAIIEQQKLQNIVLIVVMSFVMILFFVQWRNSKKRKIISDTLLIQKEEIEKQREEIIKQNEKLSKRNTELSELNYEKDTLMSIVAHDLKSPLNRIKGITDLMELEGGLSPDQRNYIRLAKESTQAGLDLITDLLDVNMIEENVEPTYSTFDIQKFLAEKLESFRQAANAKNIRLNLASAPDEEIFLDTDYLGRIVDNLISNAIKFSRKESTVEITSGKENHQFWISVKDQGQGFSDTDKMHIFQKFKKLSARPTAGESSNGLGLAIVKILVDRLKGQIELKSEKSKGSEFIVRFPLNPTT